MTETPEQTPQPPRRNILGDGRFWLALLLLAPGWYLVSGLLATVMPPRPQAQEQGPSPVTAPLACDFGHFVGKPLNPMEFQDPARIYMTHIKGKNSEAAQPGDPRRVNIELDAGNVITRIWCG